MNNLANGKAFDFQVKTSRIAGIIQIGPSLLTPKPDSAPFVTNGTGVAVGLNADRVDSLNGNEIITQAADAAVKAIQGARRRRRRRGLPREHEARRRRLPRNLGAPGPVLRRCGGRVLRGGPPARAAGRPAGRTQR